MSQLKMPRALHRPPFPRALQLPQNVLSTAPSREETAQDGDDGGDDGGGTTLATTVGEVNHLQKMNPMNPTIEEFLNGLTSRCIVDPFFLYKLALKARRGLTRSPSPLPTPLLSYSCTGLLRFRFRHDAFRTVHLSATTLGSCFRLKLGCFRS
ncbi:hypothetical protein BUALT_Bualt12G0095900 [Buddleja alternifolia]|uniref:Uncharacterized protein n=1 Tax=Buddleja alternifolia TaxID=168488 RepID=A0AAV6WPW4_9LAMI|nr:hypothetical protein BUALT_Bualt12G0095900 [Buddleja alternifolia]